SGINFSTAANTIRVGENGTNAKTRAIVFDGTGQMVLRNGLCAESSGLAGSSTKIVGDWGFGISASTAATSNCSTPGILIFDYREFYDTGLMTSGTDAQRMNWVLANSDVIAVNAYTGNILR